MYVGLNIKYPFVFSDCNETYNFLRINIQIPNLMKILPVRAEFFMRKDGTYRR